MKKILFKLLTLIIIFVFIKFSLADNKFFKKDNCLDKGGCWDSIRNNCEMENQGFCVRNSVDCENIYHGYWDIKNNYCDLKSE